MREIAQMTQIIVKRAKEYERDTVPGDYATLRTPCPKCGGVVKENYRRYACTNCDFSIGKHPGGRTFELPEVEELLAKREIGPLQGFISKMGRPFAAILRITDEYKLEFDFGQSNDEDSEPVDFSGQTPVGPCPKCQSRVFEYGMSYVCEKSVGPEKTCTFRSGKVILQQEISRAQMEKLLTEGRTDLLDGFVSSRTNRKFKAYLVRQPDGKIGFEFEPRAEKAWAARRPAGRRPPRPRPRRPPRRPPGARPRRRGNAAGAAASGDAGNRRRGTNGARAGCQEGRRQENRGQESAGQENRREEGRGQNSGLTRDPRE